MNKIKLILLGFILSFSVVGSLNLATASALPTLQSASISTSTACDGLSQLDSSQSCGGGGGQAAVGNIISIVVSTLSYIVGAVAVIMIILAGFKYVKSGGDSNNVSSAKTTLVYALVGLAIAALAQVLVHFVLNASTQAANGKTAYYPSIARSVQDA
jgi:hypothetical protein